MTKEELLARLARGSYDNEADHREADAALLEYIDDPEITAAFDPKGGYWYS